MQEHINSNLKNLTPSATLAINEHCKKIVDGGEQVHRFGFGQSPFPVPTGIVGALQSNAEKKDYLPVRGLPELREKIAQYLARSQGLEFSTENVLVGPGTKELMFILQLATDSDLILPSPTWVSYGPQAQILGRRLHWIQTRLEDGWKVTPEKLDEFCTNAVRGPALFVLTSPGNPTGVTYSPSELQQIAEVARRNQLIVLSDEIYGELNFDGGSPSFARYYPEGTIVSTGLSKWVGAGGWRLGTMAFPSRLTWIVNAMASVASETYSATCSPVQFAALSVYEKNSEVEAYTKKVRRILSFVGLWVTESLRSAGYHVVAPDGAFYVFPVVPDHIRNQFPETFGSAELCGKLLQENHVAVLPGVAFGRPATEHSFRLAYVDFDGRNALASLGGDPCDRLDFQWLRQNCPNVVAGIESLCRWVTDARG